VKRKSFLGEKIMCKHAYGNVQMPCQMIMQLGFHKRQNGKCSFIFDTVDGLSYGQLYKVHELREKNN
jgi:hypothetical protein